MMLFLLLTLHFANSAQALDLPEFSFSEAETSAQVPATPFPRAQVKNFRIQVFPHFGAYSIPQGRETSSTNVKVTSAQTCTGFAAIQDANLEWTMGGATGEISNSLSFSSGGTPRSTYYQCPMPFVVNRTAPLASIQYSGDFVAIISANSVRIINIIDPDTYVKGVIPSEVEATWPMEVLKVQAVAARTYAWWSVLQSRASQLDYDMDDTVSYQAYMGNSQRVQASDSASDQTEGLIMLFNGDIIKSYFSADSGGYTEDASEVFAPLPYCLAKPETYDVSVWASTSWTKTVATSDLSAALVTGGFLPAAVSVKTLVVKDTDRTTSGRAKIVTITGSDDQTYLVKGPNFRYATKVRSNLFTVTQSGSNFIFTGKGYGHGVGMAQIGALQYVNQLNWTYDQVLHFYYNGVTIAHE
jgi:SpoIID/LytB domain protein